jgi:transposase
MGFPIKANSDSPLETGEVSMGSAVQLRADYSGDDLRRLSRVSKDGAQTRRLLALATIYDGGSRTMAARIGGVGLQIVRDWVMRFNAHGPAGLMDRKAPGKTALLSQEHRIALAQAVEAVSKPYLDGVMRWRLLDLVQWLRDEFAVTVSRQTLGRELRVMGYAKLSARPRHYAQDAEAVEAFKKTSPPNWRRSGAGSEPVSRSRSGSRTRPASGRRTS